MKRELASAGVSARLAELRRLYVPEPLNEARGRLAREVPTESFEVAVARRLAELRALCELANYLRQAKPVSR